MRKIDGNLSQLHPQRAESSSDNFDSLFHLGSSPLDRESNSHTAQQDAVLIQIQFEKIERGRDNPRRESNRGFNDQKLLSRLAAPANSMTYLMNANNYGFS